MRLADHLPTRRQVAIAARSFAVTAALTISISTGAFAQFSVTGRWTPLPLTSRPEEGSEADWGHLQVHMALLRGDANYHSYILSWNVVPGSTWEGGLHGWNPPDSEDDCESYPFETLVEMTQPASPEVQIFCGGHSALADGRLLVTGGTDRVGETAGIEAVRIFDPQTKTWSEEDPMEFRRYYPTNTTLPDGRVLVTAGWQYEHMLTFGGRTTPGTASTAQKKIERLTMLETAHWDATITDPGGAVEWPEERAYHSAVVRKDPGDSSNEDHMRMILFGGVGTDGHARPDTWTLMRSQYYDSDETYTWAQITSGPSRARHGAIVANDHSMYVFGGIDDSTPPVAQSDVRRLFKNGLGTWEWQSKSTSGSNTPGARYGHTIAYDVSSGRNRMIVFGGRGASGLADNEVYALNFGSSYSDFSWTRLDRVSGSPSPPDSREDHTLVMGTKTYTRNSVNNWTRMIVYGGKKSAALTGETWLLWIHPTENKVEWEQLTPDTPNGAPAARSSHSAMWQRPDNEDRMLIFGGDTGGTSDPEVWALSIVGTEAEWIPHDSDGAALSGHTAIMDFISIQAPKAEIYNPSASQGQRWTTLSDPQRYQYYPFSFVLPSGNLYMAGPKLDTYLLDLDASPPQWSQGPWTNFWTWSAAMYRPGKIMRVGGLGTGGNDTAKIEFDTADATSGWVQSATNFVDRNLPNLTILPNGKVLATGGRLEPDIDTSMKQPQIWDPDVSGGTWSDTLAADPAARDHHSTAILLPDGRVLTGGVSDLNDPNGPDNSTVTIYCPPYLFDGNSLAERPVITASSDTVVWGHAFSVTTPQAGDIASAALVKPSAVTHSFNQDQRYVPLAIRRNQPGQPLILDAPLSGNWAPPGDYMLFLVDAMGVPSVSKWVRVRGDNENGECTDASPAVVEELAAPEVTRTSIMLTWTAPGGNGDCGTAYGYDVRRSTSTITEGNFYNATALTHTGYFESAGGPMCMEVLGLNPNTTYYFALKTQDAGGIWSKISNVVSETTLNSGNAIVFCDGGGLLTGGGGGGEEGLQGMGLDSAAPSAPISASEEELAENSILWPSSDEVADLYRLGSPVEREGQYTLQLRQAGRWSAEVDQLSLGVVDHDPALEAIAGPNDVLLGTVGSLSSVTDATGRDVAGLQGDEVGQPFFGKSGDHLLVQLGGASENRALVIESRRVAVGDAEASPAILVQKSVPERGWVTIAEVQPRRGFDRVAVPSQGGPSLRLLFARNAVVRSLAQMSVTQTVTPQALQLNTADHSRLGSTTDAVRQDGGATTTLDSGESLELAFSSTSAAAGQVRDFFLSARGFYSSEADQASTELAQAMTGTDGAWSFEVSDARPNPSLGRVVIDFSMAQQGSVSLRIYDAAGRIVRNLVSQELPAGPQSATWDGCDDRGKRVGPGVYFYRMDAAGWRSQKKLVVVQQ